MRSIQTQWGILAICAWLLASPAGHAQKNSASPISPYKWGMTMDEVKANSRDLKFSREEMTELVYTSDGTWHRINFNFSAGKLNKIVYSHTYYDDEDLTQEEFEGEKAGFISAYGKIEREKPSAIEGEPPDYFWTVDSTEIRMTPINKTTYWVVFTDMHQHPAVAANSAPAVTIPPEYMDKIAFEEHFDNNNNGWSILSNDNVTTEIANGAFVVDHTTDEKDQALWHEVKLDSTKDFSVECKTKWLDNSNESGYGIIWNHKNWDNTHYFLISADGYFRFVDTKNGDEGSKKWVSSYHVNKEGENTLTIRKRGDKVLYYINGSLVFTTPWRGFLGRYFGIYVSGKQKVQFDDFVVKQEGPSLEFRKTLKPKFGNLTVYTNSADLLPLQVHIKQVMSMDDLTAQLDALNNGPSPFGDMSGHSALINGTMKNVSKSMPVNDPYDGTNGNNDKPIKPSALDNEPGLAVGPFAGKNWNNNQPNQFIETESGDYYYSINLPYGKYTVSFSMYEGDSSSWTTAFGQETIVIDKESTILPVSKSE